MASTHTTVLSPELLVQWLIVGGIVFVATVYAVWRWVPGARKAAARAALALHARLGRGAALEAWAQRVLQPTGGGCADGCSSCGGCDTPSPSPATRTDDGRRLILIKPHQPKS